MVLLVELAGLQGKPAKQRNICHLGHTCMHAHMAACQQAELHHSTDTYRDKVHFVSEGCEAAELAA